MSRPFLDTNVLLYTLSADAAKADRAEALLSGADTVLSEDIHDGLVVEGLTIRNPFR